MDHLPKSGSKTPCRAGRVRIFGLQFPSCKLFLRCVDFFRLFSPLLLNTCNDTRAVLEKQ